MKKLTSAFALVALATSLVACSRPEEKKPEVKAEAPKVVAETSKTTTTTTTGAPAAATATTAFTITTTTTSTTTSVLAVSPGPDAEEAYERAEEERALREAARKVAGHAPTKKDAPTKKKAKKDVAGRDNLSDGKGDMLAPAEAARTDAKKRYEQASREQWARAEAGGKAASEASKKNKKKGKKKAPSPGPPEYVATFEPVLRRNPLALRATVPVTATFWIARAAQVNDIPPTYRAVAPSILASETIPLTVTLTCLVCDAADQIQVGHLVYDGATYTSNPVRFRIVPKLAPGDDKARNGSLTFNVIGDGIEYNHIVIPVMITGADQPIAPATTPAVATGASATAHHSMIAPDVQEKPDLIIRISPHFEAGAIGVQFEVIDPELRGIVSQYLDAHFVTPFFPSGLNMDRLDAIHAEIFSRLRQIADPHDTALKAAMEGGAALDPITLGPNVPSMMTLQESNAVLTQLATLGGMLYNRLFLVGTDSRLANLVGALEASDAFRLRHLRLQILAAGISMPWQLLHHPGADDAQGFWGLRYAMAVRPLDSQADGALRPNYQKGSGAPVVLFSGYQGSPDDPVTRLAALQLSDLRAAFSGVRFCDLQGSRAFISGLVDDVLPAGCMGAAAAGFPLVVTFTHATSGSATCLAGGELVSGQEWKGSRLLFSTTEYLRPIDIELRAAGKASWRSGSAPLATGPLVVLNGCETGTGGFSAREGLSFPNTFFSYGARGVIVTEAPAQEYFAYHFVVDTLRQLASGTPVAEGLRAQRERFLEGYRNPLGLTYSYYGTVGARLSLSATSAPIVEAQ